MTENGEDRIPTVLIADDERVNLMKLGAVLEKEGFHVLKATNGVEARQIARDARPDLILLDVMMPGMDGPTTFRELRKNPATAKIPVLLLTAKVQGSDQRRFADLGVEAVLFKPFDPLTLSTQIAGVLGWK